MWNKDAQDSFDDLRQAILKKPVLQRFDRGKRVYIRTDFSTIGMGVVALQPEDTPDAIAAMEREIAGGPCEFDKGTSSPKLLPYTRYSVKVNPFFSTMSHESSTDVR